LGANEWVQMTVAIAFDVSWKPLHIAKARAIKRAVPSRI
jgi:hypothetical protein